LNNIKNNLEKENKSLIIMENYNRYERNKKSKIELYQEKLQKRNESQDWMISVEEIII
jgi:hypothetical protein